MSDVTVETYEYQKNRIKTIFEYKFDKEGYCIGHSFITTVIPTQEESDLNQLQLELNTAVENQQFERAVEIRKQILKYGG